MLNYFLVDMKKKMCPGLVLEIGDVICVSFDMVTWLSEEYSDSVIYSYRFRVVKLKHTPALFVDESGLLEVSKP